MSCKLRTRTRLLTTAAVVWLAWGNGRTVAASAEEKPSAKEAFNQAYRNYQAAETVDAKRESIRSFLDGTPESRYTARALDILLCTHEREQAGLEESISYTVKLRTKISDAEVGLEIDLKLSEMYSKAGNVEAFSDIASGTVSSGHLSFSQFIDLIEAAVDVGDWKILERSCEGARPLANAEGFRADYPDNVFSDLEADASGKNRLGMLLTYAGWGKANTNRIESALADFQKAEGLVLKNGLGLADLPLHVFWGKTLMMQG